MSAFSSCDPERIAGELPFPKTPVAVSWLKFIDVMNGLAKPINADSKSNVEEIPLVKVLREKHDVDGNGVNHISLLEAQQLAVACGIGSMEDSIEDGIFRLVLDFCHLVGVLLHFNGSDVEDIVFLKPQYLIERITRIIREFSLHKLLVGGTVDARYGALLHLLETESKLDRKLLDLLWKENSNKERDQLLNIMLQFNLAVPLYNPTTLNEVNGVILILNV